MNADPLPSLAEGAWLLVSGLPFLLLALRFAERLVPREPAPAFRWSGAEVLAVCLMPFVLSAPLARLLPEPGLLASLLLNELVLGATALVAVLLASRRSQGLATLGLVSGAGARAFLAAPLVLVPWFFVSGGLGVGWAHLCRARGWEERQEILQLLLELTGSELVLAALIAVLLGPLLEELLFRGFLQSALAQVLGQHGALVLGAAIFAGLHGVAGLPMLFLLSLFLGWLQLRTRRLVVAWSAHALHNGVQLGLALALGEHAG